MDTALHDQFVCGLNDRKCQRELLTIQDLTLQTAIQKATAAETATRESRGIHGASAERLSRELHKMSAKPLCYRCGRSGPQPTQCKYKTFKCRNCQKVGHLASVCRSKHPADRQDKDTAKGKRIGSVQETVESDDDDSSDSLVSLYQYDKSPLIVAGECQATIKINDCTISAVFVVVDVKKQLPLLEEIGWPCLTLTLFH